MASPSSFWSHGIKPTLIGPGQEVGSTGKEAVVPSLLLGAPVTLHPGSVENQ